MTNSSYIYVPGGDLNANTLDFSQYSASGETIVFSAYGNIEYGEDNYDTIDFSDFSRDQVVEDSLDNLSEDGEIFNPGNGERVFDYLVLDNGSKILFEGVDKLVFSDQTVDLEITPDDPDFSDQWNLFITGVQNAWRLTKGSDRVLLGVLDSGLGVKDGSIHDDLRITSELYYSDNIADDFFRDVPGEDYGEKDDSHGTLVQGIIAANSDNGIGIAGINWNSDVAHIDVNVDNNPGDLTILDAASAMIDWAEERDQRLVINMSFSYGTVSEDFKDLVFENLDDVLFVISTGNDYADEINYPSILAQDFDNVIAVGAIEQNEERAEYSNYGEGITVVAPAGVLTTNATNEVEFNYTDSFDGTSAAAPHVAGIASLVWSANPDLLSFEVQNIIADTAYDLGEEGYDEFFGHGLVNADAAVRAAIAEARNDNTTVDDALQRLRELIDLVQERFPDSDFDYLEELYERLYPELPSLPTPPTPPTSPTLPTTPIIPGATGATGATGAISATGATGATGAISAGSSLTPNSLSDDDLLTSNYSEIDDLSLGSSSDNSITLLEESDFWLAPNNSVLDDSHYFPEL